jgi:energy-converting hydrogenase Eha subunit A
MPRSSRLLVTAVAVLVVLDFAGGLIAIATDLNDVGEAWSFDAGLAIPWPIILLQLGLTIVAVLGRHRLAVGAALLLTATCAVSVMAGLFDGDLFAEGLGPGEKAFQIVLVSCMALVGLLAALRTADLRRMHQELEPRIVKYDAH